MGAPRATTTSYVVLALLSLRSWSAYELAQQSERTFRWVLPRAERAVYLEVKRLAKMGWADATEEGTGKRRRKVYSITQDGQEALTAWLDDASEVHTRVSSDVLLRIFLADRAPSGSLENAVRAVRRQAEAHLGTMAHMAAAPSPFPERLATNMVALSFVAEVNAAIRDWAVEAEEALQVIESGNAAAIEAQTAALVARIVGLAPIGPEG
jgi:DNA-binding PadR family transcriptional regulator